MKKILLVVATLAAILLVAYLGNRHFGHFLTDSSYREHSMDEFEKRMALYNLSDSINGELAEEELSDREAEALKWLYSSMSLADAADYSLLYYIENVRFAFKAQRETAWGKSVPEREFRHFVLPVRVNNEKLDDFRKIYYDEEKSNSEVKYYLQYGKGLENKVDDKNIIVLL